MKSTDKKAEEFNAQTVVRYYWRHAMQYKGALFGLIAVIPITILANQYLPSLILADALSRLAGGEFVAGEIWQSFGTTLVVFAVLLFTSLGLWRVVDLFMWRLEQNVQRDIAQEVLGHLLRRSVDFHSNRFSGSLVSQSNKLIGSYVRMADTTIYQVYPMFIGIVIAVVILAPRAPLFAAALAALSTLFIVGSIFFSKKVRKLGAIYGAQESKQTGFLADAITNVMSIKSFARTKYEQKRFAGATENTLSHLKRFARAHQMQMIALGSMNRTISVVALFIAVVAVMKFKADVGTVFLIFNFTSIITNNLFEFGNGSLRNYGRAIGDANEMAVTLGQEFEVKDPKNPEITRIKNGIIDFENVTFTHAGARDAIFAKLNLRIKQGEKIGLVGHSGSGKSTFTRLLLRFSDIDGGEILIDGQNIAKITQDDLHKQIAYVPQEPMMFHRTIRENIAYGKLDATNEEVREAARKAHALEFIETLPDGFETMVGERGVKLSGGQRQRVAIARAILKDAPILVLDEATSALDSESEKLIQAALWELMKSRTAIVIAHRLSTIQRMDRIVVLDKGEIIEQGSHADLLQKDGTYAKLWAHQSGGFIEE